MTPAGTSRESRPVGRAAMPAEWEPHEATWLAWPHNRGDWPGKLSAIHWVFAEMVRWIAAGEEVRILVNDEAHEAKARSVLRRAAADAGNVRFLRIPTDRCWTRDYGPLFVRGEGGIAVVDFHFNAWAKYRDWQRDDRVARQAADVLGVPVHRPEVDGRRVVVEGGAVDVNGAGTAVVTEECLLSADIQARNPHLDRAGIERVLGSWLGAENVIWLGGGIAGDDTHGHVDGVCRFVSRDTLVLCAEPDESDVNHAPLAENRRRLEAARLPEGTAPSVVELPMPSPLYFDGARLPASYANLYIANAAVLVPTFNDPADREALGILAGLFPDRTVTGIHSVDMAWGFGTIHCATQQQPAVR